VDLVHVLWHTMGNPTNPNPNLTLSSSQLWSRILNMMCLPQWQHYDTCYVKWNPIYWLLWLCVIPMVISGKWFHALFGQGAKVRVTVRVTPSVTVRVTST